MASTYEITDQGGYTEVLLKEDSTVINRFAFSKSVSIRVRNGALEIYQGNKLVTPRIPRTLVTIPASATDEDLFNNLSFMSDGNTGGGQPSDGFYTQITGSATDITTPTQVFEIPLEANEVAILKMEGFFQQRSNPLVAGVRYFSSAVVRGGASMSITPPAIIFSGNASLVGNIFQPNATNTGVVANALSLSNSAPISWSLTLYYRIVTF